ncbi:EamA/RhaT family transporter, partial [Streptomyces sp. TRM76130]|nr:EamA/RhaT family transporter [Streptomyces sp. TRM76130]
ALAFGHTWGGFTTRPDPERQASLRGLLTVGFVGSLLAYALRCLVEAPGERLHRAEYETARARHEKRATRRSGNPEKRRR